jgi:hypothetical protein
MSLQASEPPRPGPRLTRGQALARGTVLAGGLAAGAVVLGGRALDAGSQPSPEQDRRVLDWLLQVEHLQAGFYSEAERRGGLTGEAREFAARVGEHERAHVEELERALGGQAAAAPAFDFGEDAADPERFVPAAVELEEIAVAAHNGQAPNLTDEPLLTVLRIVSVEARHVGWARDLAGRNPAPRPADAPATQDETRAAIARTGYLE